MALTLVCLGTMFVTPVFADGHSAGDAAKGEKLFKKKCKACHDVGESAKNKVGPVLTDVIGRKAGAFEGFKFSKYMLQAGEEGLVWTEEELFDYLKNPKKYMRKKLDNKKAKSKMVLKVKKDKQRANVIAYLKTLAKPAE